MIVLTLASLCTAVVLYPILHECGHLLSARLVGVDVSGCGLLIDPHVAVDLPDDSPRRVLFIAVSGGWFPLLWLAAPDFRFFPLYFCKATIAVMSGLCGIVSAARGVLFLTQGLYDGFDDAVIVLRQFPFAGGAVFAALGIQTAVAAGYLMATHPLGRTVCYGEKLIAVDR